jgi:peptidyl-prolyl cis-trans isomerase B (cyclophilin B)
MKKLLFLWFDPDVPLPESIPRTPAARKIDNSMKRLLTTLPLTLLLLGCGPSATRDTAANATVANGDAGDYIVTDASRNATAAATPAGGATTSGSEADSAYRVVEEGGEKVPPPPKDMKVPDKARVRLLTSKGPITVELNGKEAPLHVKSFLYLAKRGFFDGTRFHRFADLMQGSGTPGRIIQGGDPLSKKEETRAQAGTGGPGYQIPRERNALKHDRLVIAAARSDDPDSAGSQFYITQDPVYFLDTTGDGYTVFGKVVEGQANALKLRQDDELKSATVLDGAAGKPKSSAPAKAG